ncbi:hypothetical protein HK096_002905 [Nowakowskiella sp. JEL0078]|nr:hypothetical protein HK096_002905 [Nowakowskiella sp. JEL0078]
MDPRQRLNNQPQGAQDNFYPDQNFPQMYAGQKVFVPQNPHLYRQNNNSPMFQNYSSGGMSFQDQNQFQNQQQFYAQQIYQPHNQATSGYSNISSINTSPSFYNSQLDPPKLSPTSPLPPPPSSTPKLKMINAPNLQTTQIITPSLQSLVTQLPTSHSISSGKRQEEITTFARQVLEIFVGLSESLNEAIFLSTNFIQSGDRGNVVSATHFAITTILDGLGFMEIVLLMCRETEDKVQTVFGSPLKKAEEKHQNLLVKLSEIIQHVSQYQTITEEPNDMDEETFENNLADLDQLLLNDFSNFEEELQSLIEQISSIFQRQTLTVITFKVLSKDPETMRSAFSRSDDVIASNIVRIGGRLSNLVLTVLGSLREINSSLQTNSEEIDLKSATTSFMSKSYDLLSVADTFFSQLEKFCKTGNLVSLVSGTGNKVLVRARGQYPDTLKSVADRSFKISFAAQALFQNPTTDSRRQLKFAALGFEDALQSLVTLAMEISGCLNEGPTMGTSPPQKGLGNDMVAVLDRLNIGDEQPVVKPPVNRNFITEIDNSVIDSWKLKLEALSFEGEVVEDRFSRTRNLDTAPSIEEITIKRRIKLHQSSKSLALTFDEVFNSVLDNLMQSGGTPFRIPAVRQLISKSITAVGQLDADLDQILIVLSATTGSDLSFERGPRSIVQREVQRLQETLEQTLSQSFISENGLVPSLQQVTRPLFGAVKLSTTLVKYVDGLLLQTLEQSPSENEGLPTVEEPRFINIRRDNSQNELSKNSPKNFMSTTPSTVFSQSVSHTKSDTGSLKSYGSSDGEKDKNNMESVFGMFRRQNKEPYKKKDYAMYNSIRTAPIRSKTSTNPSSSVTSPSSSVHRRDSTTSSLSNPKSPATQNDSVILSLPSLASSTSSFSEQDSIVFVPTGQPTNETLLTTPPPYTKQQYRGSNQVSNTRRSPSPLPEPIPIGTTSNAEEEFYHNQDVGGFSLFKRKPKTDNIIKGSKVPPTTRVAPRK